VLVYGAIRVGTATQDISHFAALYDQYYGRVYNYIRYRCDDPALAEDLTAQVFERLLVHLGKYSPERGPFEPWLFAIVRNVVADHFRAQRRLAWMSWDLFERQPSADTAPEDRVIERQAHAALSEALKQLNERERDLIGLKFAGGLNNREIAQLTGLSESNVGVSLYRAINRLRAALSPSDGMVCEKELSDGRA